MNPPPFDSSAAGSPQIHVPEARWDRGFDLAHPLPALSSETVSLSATPLASDRTHSISACPDARAGYSSAPLGKSEMMRKQSNRGMRPFGGRLQRLRRDEQLLGRDAFLRALARESGRYERSGESFALVVMRGSEATEADFELLRQFCANRLRITDEAGWLEDDAIGILLPGAATREARAVARKLFLALGTAVARFQCTIYSDDGGFGEPSAGSQDADGWIQGPEPLSQLFVIPVTWIKRCMDICGAITIGLLSLPVLLIAACAIKLETKGPAFFKQTRVGQGGREFTLYKLRTMVVDAEARLAELKASNERSGPAFKMGNDPRVTRVGRFLRKSCLDELPQLWNVLRGDMSLVGPRPALPNEVAEYEPWQRQRLHSNAGLTGLWQVQGKAQNVSFQDWVRMDLRYQSQASPFRDMILIGQTAWVLLLSRGDA